MRLLSSVGEGRLRPLLALLALLLAACAAYFAPALTGVPLLVAALIIAWDRATLERDLRALAARVAAEQFETKLEVGEGAWGELRHALNRLLQQRRAQRQLQPLLPSLPAARLADLHLPPEGLICDVAVLALSRASLPRDAVAGLRAIAEAALTQAEAHHALLVRADERVLLVFGALGQQSHAAELRSAHAAATALQRCWASQPPNERPRLSLAVGQARAFALPGLGYTVVGPPIEQALALQALAVGNGLLCNEEAYLGLRHLGATPPQLAPPRLRAADGGSAAYAVPL